MCGIAGRINFKTSAPVDPAVVARMCAFIAHRGPDGEGVWVDGHAGLGHRRLAIIDLSPLGRQPMLSEDERVVVTFNGEIYNFLELRADLEGRGHRFRSRSDTEVILAAYREYGVDCVDHLRGMFAFVLYDRDTRTTLLARDRVGKKPLFYRVDRDGLAFASEPKAFFAEPSFTATPNLAALSLYLSYQYVPSPASAFEGVSKLPPAHVAVVRDGVVDVRRYWRLRYEPKLAISPEDACDELRRRLAEAVRLRLISDVPLGVFLSGGIDSSAVAALMAREGSGPVKTFSIGFDEKDYDELPYARLVAERYGTDHHELVVKPDAVEMFPRLVWQYGEPYADESAIPTYYLARFARESVTVALNGDGGDESFAGYKRYVPDVLDAWGTRVPDVARAGLKRLAPGLVATGPASYVRRRLGEKLAAVGATPEARYATRMMHFSEKLKREVCTEGFLAASDVDDRDPMDEAFASSDAKAWVDRMLDADIQTYLPDCLLVKVDIATMAHGLEGRSPLLDHEFMSFAASLPSDLKLKGDDKKHILKRALGSLVPDEILHRPKKGFGVPLDHWFRHDLRPVAEELLLSGTFERRGYLRPGVARRFIDEHARGVQSWRHQIWNLVMLELWHQTFIDTRPSGPLAVPGAAGSRALEAS
ncbi:MAG: asparagine synthase (glutamine-hydrolyzing) [Vicinamibacterales bacterium]